ncbi:hypothetical protein TNIN_45791 [Trichonephila inaurata madagascariensis]|uniref:Uncharacterized protein n=1 Tax=Trichonephila inaurata madagascariensis TaxID=2747483 RepID=A0A8X6X7X5_9ARAC|nr:hypothetical protein TNIN_45791 [Trichonephila inaurata madagascariensis]
MARQRVSSARLVSHLPEYDALARKDALRQCISYALSPVTPTQSTEHPNDRNHVEPQKNGRTIPGKEHSSRPNKDALKLRRTPLRTAFTKAVNHLQEIVENDPVDVNALETAFEMFNAKGVKLKKIDEDILELMIESDCMQEAYNI